MTEEENKAIAYLKRHIIPYYGYKGRIEFMLNDVILNLIEKLQKENEELKEQKEIDMYLIGDSISKEIVKRDYIPKDKIRDKLDEIMSYTFTSIEERHQQNYAYDRIRELLEEE